MYQKQTFWYKSRLQVQTTPRGNHGTNEVLHYTDIRVKRLKNEMDF